MDAGAVICRQSSSSFLSVFGRIAGFQQHSPATVQGGCVGGEMKGRNLNVSGIASSEPLRISQISLRRLAAGMRTQIQRHLK